MREAGLHIDYTEDDCTYSRVFALRVFPALFKQVLIYVYLFPVCHRKNGRCRGHQAGHRLCGNGKGNYVPALFWFFGLLVYTGHRVPVAVENKSSFQQVARSVEVRTKETMEFPHVVSLWIRSITHF